MSIVIELGSVYARIGLSGDSYPRSSVSYTVSSSRFTTSDVCPISVLLYKTNFHSPHLATPVLKAFLRNMYKK